MIQGKQALQEFRVGQRHRPAIRWKHRGIQLPMRLRQPTGAGVVEIRKGALFQFLCAGVRRIEPRVPLLYQFAGGFCNGLHER